MGDYFMGDGNDHDVPLKLRVVFFPKIPEPRGMPVDVDSEYDGKIDSDPLHYAHKIDFDYHNKRILMDHTIFFQSDIKSIGRQDRTVSFRDIADKQYEIKCGSILE